MTTETTPAALRLSEGLGRWFRSALYFAHHEHPDAPRAIPLKLLTHPARGWCQSGNGRGCNPRACKFIGGSIPPRPTTVSSRSTSGEVSRFSPCVDGSDSHTGYQLRAVPRRAQSGLENRGIGNGDGSIPSLPASVWKVARVAMGRLAKPRPVRKRRERSTRSPSASHERPNVAIKPPVPRSA